MDVQLCVTTPLGSIYQTEVVIKDCLVTIHGEIFPTDLVLFKIQGYNIILDMD